MMTQKLKLIPGPLLKDKKSKVQEACVCTNGLLKVSFEQFVEDSWKLRAALQTY